MTAARKSPLPLGTYTGKIDARALVQRLTSGGKKRAEKKAAAMRALHHINAGMDLGQILKPDRDALVNLCGWPRGGLELQGGTLITRYGHLTAWQHRRPDLKELAPPTVRADTYPLFTTEHHRTP